MKALNYLPMKVLDSVSLVLNPRLIKLQIELYGILELQKIHWKNAYNPDYFYQGLNEIGILGCRNTEQRFKAYELEKYLNKDMHVLDIGSNNGFFSLYTAKFVKLVYGVENNYFLNQIAHIVQKFLKRRNVIFMTTKFEDVISTNKFDAVFSFANHSTIDGNTEFTFKQYINSIRKLLKKNGYLFFESHTYEGNSILKKMEFVYKYFDLVSMKRVWCSYPVALNPRWFFVLRKKEN